MTDPQPGDPQAASGGRRNIPLVPLLAKLDPLEWLGEPEREQRHPLAWAKGMVAGENTWAAIYEWCQRNGNYIHDSLVEKVNE